MYYERAVKKASPWDYFSPLIKLFFPMIVMTVNVLTTVTWNRYRFALVPEFDTLLHASNFPHFPINIIWDLYFFLSGRAAWRIRMSRCSLNPRIPISCSMTSARSGTAPSGPSTTPGTMSPRKWWPSRRCPTAGSRASKSGKTSSRKSDSFGGLSIPIASVIRVAT